MFASVQLCATCVLLSNTHVLQCSITSFFHCGGFDLSSDLSETVAQLPQELGGPRPDGT